MPLYGEVAAGSGTSITLTFNLPNNAKIVGLNLAKKGSGLITGIEIKAAGLQQPFKTIPPIAQTFSATNYIGLETAPTPLIPLNIQLKGTNTLTVTITCSASETVTAGLMYYV